MTSESSVLDGFWVSSDPMYSSRYFSGPTTVEPSRVNETELLAGSSVMPTSGTF